MTATDRGGLTARTRVVVTLEDRNEGPVFVEPIWEWELAEHVAGPVELGAVEATDVDAGDTLRYSLSGTRAALFDVGESSGAVRYVGAGEDAETGPEGWEFEVVATDRAGLAAVAKVRVLLLDVNEVPAFRGLRVRLRAGGERARAPGAGSGRGDGPGPRRRADVQLGAGRRVSRFQVDGASGQVRYVGGGEDYEDGPPEFALTVRVTDVRRSDGRGCGRGDAAERERGGRRRWDRCRRRRWRWAARRGRWVWASTSGTRTGTR